jgi:hypothetical protein
LSPDFKWNKSLEVQCRQTSAANNFQSFSIEVSVPKTAKYCSNAPGQLLILDQNSINFELITNLQLAVKQILNLEPKIIRTDESLRSLDPVQWVEVQMV